MKNSLSKFFIICVLVICTACPNKYESPVAAGEANEKIDPAILGTWDVESSETKTYYVITEKDEFNYNIIEYSAHPGSSRLEEKDFVGHINVIGGKTFVSVKRRVESAQVVSYNYVYKLEILSTERIDIYPLSEYIREKFKSPSELKDFISSNMEQSYFYGNESKLKKRL